MTVIQIANNAERNDKINQARADGAEVADDAAVYKVADEFTGIYAIEDVCDFVFLENAGGLFVPDENVREEFLEQLLEQLG